jgi:Family of unknown function (DUF6951)
MIRTEISAGVCGFHTTVLADSPDSQNVTLEITSDCENIRALADSLRAPIDAYQEIGHGFEGVVHRAARASHSSNCAGCVVPGGIFKSVQAAAALALPAEASIRIERMP